MSRCDYITQDEIEKAFSDITEAAVTNIFSKSDLIDKISSKLRLTKGQLKAQHVVAFLSCHMLVLGWKYDLGTESFHKIILSNTCQEVLVGMDRANYTPDQIRKVENILTFDFDGEITSCELDNYQVRLSNTNKGLKRVITIGEL